MNKIFTDRINYRGDLTPVLQDVCKKYELGNLTSLKVIEIGYEDLNIKVETSNRKYLIKIFGSFRDENNINRYVDIMKKVVEMGISHPKLYQANGSFIYKYNQTLHLCVMDFVDGKSFYDLNARPTMDEAKFLISEASKINSLNIEPEDYYDEWSPVNLIKEFELKGKYLPDEDKKRVEKFVEPFSKVYVTSLVQTFVHGDIIRPNVLKDSSSKIYIVDFSCASLKPRVQELAILLCGMFFNEEDPMSYQEFYDLVLAEYQPKLNQMEIEALPLFVKAGFSMYVMQGIYTKVVKGIDHKENDYWIRLGQIGLEYLS